MKSKISNKKKGTSIYDTQGLEKPKQQKRDKELKPSVMSGFIETFFFFTSLIFLFGAVLAFKDSILDANNIPSGSMIPTLKIGDYLFVNKMRYNIRLPFTDRGLIHISNPKRGDIITFLPPNEGKKHYVKRVMGMPEDRIRLKVLTGCEVRKKMLEKALTPKLKAEMRLLGEPKIKNNFKCSDKKRDNYEPLLTIVEYKPKDNGPWLEYELKEVSLEKSLSMLMDADNVSVLPPEAIAQISLSESLPRPIVYKERVGEKEHYLVETALSSEASMLCPNIYTSGCVIPPDYYFVMGDNRDFSKDSRFIGFVPRENIFGKPVFIYFSINWRDDVCAEYWRIFREGKFDPSFNTTKNIKDGFLLKDFPPSEQIKKCSMNDLYQIENWAGHPIGVEFLFEYLTHTLRYRIPRMSVRWQRPGTFLK